MCISCCCCCCRMMSSVVIVIVGVTIIYYAVSIFCFITAAPVKFISLPRATTTTTVPFLCATFHYTVSVLRFGYTTVTAATPVKFISWFRTSTTTTTAAVKFISFTRTVSFSTTTRLSLFIIAAVVVSFSLFSSKLLLTLFFHQWSNTGIG